jgi:hypothetical protein
MEERYKDTVILVTALPSGKNLRWQSSCKIKFMKGARELVEYLKLDMDYDTGEQAERAGLVFSKSGLMPESLNLRPRPPSRNFLALRAPGSPPGALCAFS